MVTKKDFKAIAEIIKQAEIYCHDTGNYGGIANGKKIANDLADYFATQNPRFDRQKFLDVCGL